ncbi:MAG TPA: protein kinase [Blastocatellia bacterium]|jgi:serine/threonine-protein kinase
MKPLLPTDTTISHYRILSPLGAGGMGEVYLAEDTHLGRRVALKILPPDFTGDEDRLRRFEQEARAASSLNHPNIITIHEVGQENGLRFIAAEFIEGETIRQLLARGRMDVRKAIDVSIQVASALAAAHRAGIIHRDIKPENVMLRPDGYVKVLDFGVVKLTERFISQQTGPMDSASEIKTAADVVLGSPSYMSPEQARGLTVDARTDIFSLGVLLYEMISGQRPFDGETLSDIIVAILERRPRPLSECAADVSPRLEHAVNRALAKKREERYQTIDEMLKDLRRVKQRADVEAGIDESISPDLKAQKTALDADPYATVKYSPEESGSFASTRATSSAEYIITEIRRHKKAFALALAAIVLGVVALIYSMRGDGREPINSIAVLPFVNESADQNIEYLSDGITETLIDKLSEWRSLKVMARNSVFQYKGREENARAAGRDLNVRAVLTGRIVQRGDEIQIKIELVDTSDGSRLWGEQYNRPVSDLMAVQEEIARQVSEKLRLRLAGEDEKRASKRYTDDAEAYQLYLKGRYYWNKRTQENIEKGIEYFRQAIDRDPLYALAYAGQADCYAMLTEYSSQPPKEIFPKVKAAAQKALEIDDSLAEAHTSLAAAYEYEWNWTEAEKQYRRAIELNPNYATAHHWYAVFLGARLRHDEALREMRLALELDPLSLIINTSMGRLLYGARQYDQAVDQLRKTLELDQNFAEARFHIAMAYEQKRMYGEAIAEFQKAIELFHDQTMIAWVGREYALSGKRSEAERVIKELNEMAREGYVSPYPMATVYAALGARDKAFEYLERVYEERSYYVVWLNIDPVFDGMREDARFQDLLHRIGIAPQ